MTTNEDIRITAIERRMDKYDEIVQTIREAVIELKARSDSNYKWMTGLIAISSAVVGGLIGHFVH
jgi:hypothetical protein